MWLQSGIRHYPRGDQGNQTNDQLRIAQNSHEDYIGLTWDPFTELLGLP